MNIGQCNNTFIKSGSRKIKHFAYPAFRDSSKNTLLKQALCDDNLDKALDWLRHSAREQDNSDVWHLSYRTQYWVLHKENLKQSILGNAFENSTFTFQVVRDVESQNEQGQRQVREIRSAKDRILIRALSQVLTPIVQAATPKECTHLANRGGLKGAVKDIQSHLNQYPNAFVYKSDVKSYYASIEHRILHDQLCLLFPNEPILCRLFWQFMQRTVERSGNYCDFGKGITLGSSLSPLLAAIYLIPLDKAFSHHPHFFYRRYMDDWVILCHSRRVLRQTTKKVYSIMKSLNVEIHPDKTWLGRVKNGFDFLGFRITPTSIQASTESVSRRVICKETKVVKRYEQGASTKRIGQYPRRWLGWSVLCAAQTAVGAPGDVSTTLSNDCSTQPDGVNTIFAFTQDNGTNDNISYNFQTGSTDMNQLNSVNTFADNYLFIAPTPTLPTLPYTHPQYGPLADETAVPLGTIGTQERFVVAGGGPAPGAEICVFRYLLDAAGNRTSFTVVTALATTAPVSVPIFTPLGLIATVSGLLWFGRRRSIKLKST